MQLTPPLWDTGLPPLLPTKKVSSDVSDHVSLRDAKDNMLLGIGLGYLLHPPKAVVPGPVQAQLQAAPADVMAGGMPTTEQMNHVASKATEPILNSLQKDPNNADLLGKAGSVYYRAQQFETAASYFERASKIKSTPEGIECLPQCRRG